MNCDTKKEIIEIGRKLYNFRFVAARGGNLSACLEADKILITAGGTCLGELKESDILSVDLAFSDVVGIKGLSTEFPLHSMIFRNLPVKRIVHCHPPLINAYFSVYKGLKSITFENKLFLGNVPVIAQTTPNISRPEEVVEALKTNNIVVIKNHGIVCIGDGFSSVFYLIEELEEAVKMAGFAKLLAKDELNVFEAELKKELNASGKSYEMFSREHILSIVELINQDEMFFTRASDLGLTAQVAIKMNEQVFKFVFANGRITEVKYDDDAPFVISGPQDVWRLIFEGRIDPFVATTQGKLKLNGELGKLSRWYVPFSRMFSLFKEVRIK